jgi:RimJ/RimL family protein N-acetyltransferase
MAAPLKLQTARLTLIAPTTADAEAMFERYASDPDVTRYLGWPRHETVADTLGFLAFSESQWARDGVGPYLIRSRTHGRLLGSTGLALEAEDHAATGYVLAKDSWGKGYATEALNAMVDVARGLHLARVYALCHAQHEASTRVLEKCGFERDRSWTRQYDFPNLAPGVPQDVLCYERWLGVGSAVAR